MGPSGAGKTTFMNALCGRCYYGTAETFAADGMGGVCGSQIRFVLKDTFNWDCGIMPQEIDADPSF